MTTFLRFRAGDPRRTEPGKFNDLYAGHPLVGESCCVCDQPLQVGQRVTLFAVGPTTVEDAQKADSGRWYNALAIVGHESCLWASKEKP